MEVKGHSLSAQCMLVQHMLFELYFLCKVALAPLFKLASLSSKVISNILARLSFAQFCSSVSTYLLEGRVHLVFKYVDSCRLYRC